MRRVFIFFCKLPTFINNIKPDYSSEWPCLRTWNAYPESRRAIAQGKGPRHLCRHVRWTNWILKVCIIDQNNILLLVQKDNRHMDSSDPEPQFIAETIATFAANNPTPLVSKIMAGITMMSTAPIFYKIKGTAALVTSVRRRGFTPCRHPLSMRTSPMSRDQIVSLEWRDEAIG
jgi:hypothetical protein